MKFSMTLQDLAFLALTVKATVFGISYPEAIMFVAILAHKSYTMFLEKRNVKLNEEIANKLGSVDNKLYAAGLLRKAPNNTNV